MKRIDFATFRADLPAEEQFAKHFVQCGLNADWSATAYHISVEAWTGHKPNTVSGDFYLIQNEDYEGGWVVVIRTYAKDRPALDSLDDVIEEVAAFHTAADAWEWLADPVSQAHYLLAPVEDINDARGLPFQADRLSAVELQAPLSLHTYLNSRIGRIPAEKDTNNQGGYQYQNVTLGFGNLRVGMIEGNGYERMRLGFPCLTIPEARAVAAQIIARWNATPDLVAALNQCIEVYEATRRAEPTGHLWPDPSHIHNARRALKKLEGKTE